MLILRKPLYGQLEQCDKETKRKLTKGGENDKKVHSGNLKI